MTTIRTNFTCEYFGASLQSTITYKPDVNGNVQNSTQIASVDTTGIGESVNISHRTIPPFRCRQSLL